jgi:Phosphotransferase enzyme family
METATYQFPDLRALPLGLTCAFRSNEYSDARLTVRDRKPHLYVSTFASEIVTCRMEDGRELQLFCKYGAGHPGNFYGHKAGAPSPMDRTAVTGYQHAGCSCSLRPKERTELMQPPLSLFPDLQTLTVGLMSVFRGNGSLGGQLAVLERKPNLYASTFPSEIVTCRFDDGRERRLLCKYAAGRSHHAHGHRGGVVYEAEVYSHVLQPLQASTPTFYGAHTDSTAGETWLILEYLDKSVRLSKTPESATMELAARWIGRFHAANKARLAGAPMSFLNRYDAEYYLGWVRRTSLFAGHLHRQFSWLAALCERSERFVAPLLAPPPTVIHGEYYPKNILFRRGRISPVDWESAAVAAGEIDLASLTEGWPAEIVQKCELEYQRARWPEGSPIDFEQTLGAARLYLLFRWLGDRPDWTTHESSLWLFEQLHSTGEQLGLI